MIYELSVQHNIAAAMCDTESLNKRWPQPSLGALALIHTSTSTREESLDFMYALAHRQWRTLRALSGCLIEAINVGARQTPSHLTMKHFTRYLATLDQVREVRRLCTALEEVCPRGCGVRESHA